MDRSKQKAEALERMKMLQLYDPVLEEFEENNTLYLSENLGSIFKAFLYWASNSTYPGLMDEVRRFEERTGYLVYHVQLSHLNIGDCYSLFFVSTHEEDWGQEKAALSKGFPIVYVWNADDPDSSEMGGVEVKPSYGGVTRVF